MEQFTSGVTSSEVVSSADLVENADLSVSYDGYYTTDGATIFLYGTDSYYVDLTDARYNMAFNIDATNSLGQNKLYGNFAVNVIVAGNNSSELWGGTDFTNDILVGGAGADTFFHGHFQGTDTILNASSFDMISLYNASVTDIIQTSYDGTTLALFFNTGTALAVSCTDMLSPIFVTADGSRFVFNRITGSWQ